MRYAYSWIIYLEHDVCFIWIHLCNLVMFQGTSYFVVYPRYHFSSELIPDRNVQFVKWTLKFCLYHKVNWGNWDRCTGCGTGLATEVPRSQSSSMWLNEELCLIQKTNFGQSVRFHGLGYCVLRGQPSVICVLITCSFSWELLESEWCSAHIFTCCLHVCSCVKPVGRAEMLV